MRSIPAFFAPCGAARTPAGTKAGPAQPEHRDGWGELRSILRLSRNTGLARGARAMAQPRGTPNLREGGRAGRAPGGANVKRLF